MNNKYVLLLLLVLMVAINTPRRALMAEVSGGRVRRRPRLRWMDGVKVTLGNRGQYATMRERSKEWRALLHM